MNCICNQIARQRDEAAWRLGTFFPGFDLTGIVCSRTHTDTHSKASYGGKVLWPLVFSNSNDSFS